jgi:SAM-dependent methyltransferase
MGILNELAIKHVTDKSSIYHDYCDEYEFFLNGYRDKAINILEIGVSNGNSIRMWLDYFLHPNTNVYGVDISNKDLGLSDGRYKFFCGDQTDENVYSSIGDLDIIIDDGSHICDHQRLTFEILFKKLKSGGMYIVEDVCTSYWSNWGNSFIEYTKQYIDTVNYNGIYNEVDLLTEHPNCPFPIRSYARNSKYLDSTMARKNMVRNYDIRSIYYGNSFIIFFKK